MKIVASGTVIGKIESWEPPKDKYEIRFVHGPIKMPVHYIKGTFTVINKPCEVCQTKYFDVITERQAIIDTGKHVVCGICQDKTARRIREIGELPVEDLPLYVNDKNVLIREYIFKRLEGKSWQEQKDTN